MMLTIRNKDKIANVLTSNFIVVFIAQSFRPKKVFLEEGYRMRMKQRQSACVVFLLESTKDFISSNQQESCRNVKAISSILKMKNYTNFVAQYMGLIVPKYHFGLRHCAKQLPIIPDKMS